MSGVFVVVILREEAFYYGVEGLVSGVFVVVILREEAFYYGVEGLVSGVFVVVILREEAFYYGVEGLVSFSLVVVVVFTFFVSVSLVKWNQIFIPIVSLDPCTHELPAH